MRFLRTPLISAADASVSQTSAAIDLSLVIAVSLQIVITGNAVGSVVLQVSNDQSPNGPIPTPPTNWLALPGSTTAVAGAGVYMIPKTDMCYEYIRAVFTSSSGTGTITMNLKTIGF